MKETTPPVEKYYDSVAREYGRQYSNDNFYDINRTYPSDYFRLQILINSFLKNGVKRAIEIGVGEGTPLVKLNKAGIDTCGIDISHSMIREANANLISNGLDGSMVQYGNIEDPASYCEILADGKFDGLLAMGVMPHVKNDDFVIENMSNMLNPGGIAFVEFRNKLFSLFSFNRYTVDFVINDLLKNVDNEVKMAVRKDLESRLRVDMPPVRGKTEDGSPGYDSILSKFHNPFEVRKTFERLGFTDIKFHYYHYHAATPYLEPSMPELFRKESIDLEHESSDWRGLFMCSAFIVEARNDTTGW